VLNKVMLIGNVGKDPEVRSTRTGEPVATFSMATSRKWKDPKTGQRQEQTEWHTIVCWSQIAKVVGDYVKRGKLVYVEGRLQTRSWDDKGEKRYRTEIICEKLLMLGTSSGKPESSDAEGTGAPGDEGEDLPY